MRITLSTCLRLAVLVNFEIFFIKVGYQLTFFVSDRTGDVHQFDLNLKFTFGSIRCGQGAWRELRKVGRGR